MNCAPTTLQNDLLFSNIKSRCNQQNLLIIQDIPTRSSRL
jgi:hypothetical protein